MKTPDEIKKGLRCFAYDDVDCLYCICRLPEFEECNSSVAADALSYIRQLEEDRKERDILADAYQQLEAERDAIEKDFAHVAKQLDLAFACEYRMHYFSGYGCKTCDFQWKGYQPEPPSEDA
jgi:hypothetical protein